MSVKSAMSVKTKIKIKLPILAETVLGCSAGYASTIALTLLVLISLLSIQMVGEKSKIPKASKALSLALIEMTDDRSNYLSSLLSADN